MGSVGALVALGLGVAAAGEISPEAQPFLKQLDSKDAFLRQEAFVRLEALRDPATASVVRPYLTSRNLETRTFAVRAVAAIEGVQAVPTLLAQFKRERPTVRIAILLALEPLQAQDPSIAPVLLAALRDRKPQVRMAAVDIVSRLKQPQAREAILTRWKRERHRDVRRVLELAMKRIGAL
jgi:HEAT repeat protein